MKTLISKTIIQQKYVYENFLKDLSGSYPSFRDWYWNKLIPKAHRGEAIITMYFKKNEMVGVGIVDLKQHKLSTVRVSKLHANKGIGIHIIEDSLKLLSIDKPVCSVNESLFHSYSRIFINYFDFNITNVYKNLYLKGKLEYEFNGNKGLRLQTQY